MKTVEPSAPRFRLRRFSPLSRSTRSVVLGLVMVVAIGATAVGSVPSADGRIFACYSSSNMRIIDKEAGDTCRKGERQLEWNQVGPRGPQGLQGEPGPQGPPGSGGQEVATHVWVEDLRNVPTTLEVDSDDLVPEGARLKATSIEVLGPNGDPELRDLPSSLHVHASVGNSSLANFVKSGDQVDRTYSPERTTSTATKLHLSLASSAPSSRLLITLRFVWTENFN